MEERDVAAAPILQPQREAAGVAETGHSRRHEREGDRLCYLGRETAIDSIDKLSCLELRPFAFAPRLQRHEVEGVVAGGYPRDEVEPCDRGCILNASSLAEEFLDFARHHVGAFQ